LGNHSNLINADQNLFYCKEIEMSENTKNLKREIGLIGLSANIVNIVIGAGIFALPAIVAAGL